MKSFSKYVTPKRIISLLAKERAKCARNGSLNGGNDGSPGGGLREGICKEISSIMPPRNLWHNLPQRLRARHESADVRNVMTILQTIKAHRKAVEVVGAGAVEAGSAKDGIAKDGNAKAGDYGYLLRLDSFVDDIISTVRSGEFNFDGGMSVVAKFKEDDEHGNAIYRPLCMYTSLKTKILIALASKYLTTVLDPFLHNEILAYRARREYHGQMKVTDGSDAIRRVKEFLGALRPDDEVFVAECDIQKFFDIINHDIVLKCFDAIACRAKIPEYQTGIRRALEAYLNSYSFAGNIMSLNGDDEFWRKAKSAHKGPVKRKCMFKWVDEQVLAEYYEAGDFPVQRGRLGVPQGGALSCIIANVVLDSVDRAAGLDVYCPDKLFVRYGDDIILLHRDSGECERLIEAYASQLREHKLVSHKFHNIEQFKSGEKLTAGYWGVKSKSTFRFGKGSGNAAEWIGFVGYEINRKGEVRLRKSSLDKRFGDINKRYHSCHLDDPKNVASYMRHNRKKVAGIPSCLKRYPALDLNTHSGYQMKSLDRYRWVKVKRLQQYFNAHKPLQRYLSTCSVAQQMPEDLNFVQKYLADRTYSFYHKLKEQSSR